jgi:hypothetical protein
MKKLRNIVTIGAVLFGVVQAKSADLRLQEGTPVRLRLKQTISSAHAVVDDRIYFEAVDETKLNGIVVIPRGSLGVATVTEAQTKRRLGRGGKLNINIDFVRLGNGDQCPLRARRDSDPSNHYGREVGETVAATLVFWPAAPLFLLQHGKDVKIAEGTEITAYIASDIALETKDGAVVRSNAVPSLNETPKPAIAAAKTDQARPTSNSAQAIEAEEAQFKSAWGIK